MRQGIGCLLGEALPGSLAEVRRCLETWRFVCETVPAMELAGAGATALVVLDLRAGAPLPDAADLAARTRAGAATLALCPEGDAWALSMASSLACDDVLTIPLDPIELVRRLQTLHNLTALGAEMRLRRGLFAAYRDPDAAPIFETLLERPSVVLLGRPAPPQVAITAAMPPARLAYLDGPMRLGALLRTTSIDVLVVTDPELLARTLEAVDAMEGQAPFILAAHAGPPWALELPSQVDLLGLPAPTGLIRRRLELALRVAELRRWLRDPPLGGARALLVDSLTGLYNQGAFLDYLRHTEGERMVIALEYEGLDGTNREAGYAAGNRILARLGGSLRRRVRAQDLAAHLGGGRLAVAVAAATPAKLDRLRSRLQGTIAGSEPWSIRAGAESWPAYGAPAQRLARLFGDLRRLRRAA